MKHCESQSVSHGRLLVTLVFALIGAFAPASVLADNPGLALQFDGTSDFVRLAATSDILGSAWRDTKSVVLWVQPTGVAPTVTDVASADVIFGDRPRLWGISRGVIGGQDRIWVWNYDGNFDQIGIEYTTGQWVQIALVHNGGTLRAYKNGFEVGSVASGPTPLPPGGAVLHFGGIINSASKNWTFQGKIDEVSIWNIALAGAEIAAWMNLEITSAHPNWANLSAYYKMSDGLGTTVTDDSVNSWTGTLNDGGSGVPADGPISWVTSGAFSGGGGTPGNNPPVANGQTVTTLEDAAAAITLSGSDPDLNPLTFRVVTQPSQGTLTGTAPNLTYTPNSNSNGSDSLTFVVNDGQVDSAPAIVALTVTAVNDVPSFIKGSDQAIPEDAGAQSLAWATSISAGPANESDQVLNFIVSNDNTTLFAVQPAVAANGTLTYTPATNKNGMATVTVRIHDNGGTTNGGIDTSLLQIFTIAITAINDQPVATDGTVIVNEDAPSGISIDLGTLVSDAETADADLAYTIVSGPANGVLSPISGREHTYKPNSDFFGADSFTYQVTDRGDPDNCNPGPNCEASLSSMVKTVTITVNPVNDAPSFTGGANQIVSEDAPGQSLPWATGMSAGPANESGQVLNFIVSNSNNALFAVQPAVAADGTLTCTLAADKNGAATVTVQLRDNGGTQNGGIDTSAPHLFTVTVTPVNDPPVAIADAAATVTETPVTVAVLNNDSDVDGDALTITTVGTPSNGAVLNNGSSVTYTANAGYTGLDTFSYTISDGNGGTATATVTITVNPPGTGAGFALRFDGVSDFVRLGETRNMLAPGWETNKTVSLWVKPTGVATCSNPTGAPGCDAIFGDRSRWWGMARGAVGGLDRIWIWNWDGNLDQIGIPYILDEWVHISLVHSTGILKAYKNGVLVASIVSGATQQPTQSAVPFLQIGGVINNSNANWSFQGEIDEVSIWNTALSPQTILDWMNRGITASHPNWTSLAAYYKMLNGSGTSLTDDSGHGWTGTLNDGGPGVPANGPIAWVPSAAPLD